MLRAKRLWRRNCVFFAFCIDFSLRIHRVSPAKTATPSNLCSNVCFN